jgi:hypothetical protein
MNPYFYPVYPVPYIPMVKYAQNPPTNPSMWDKLTPYVPYFQAAGIGAGLGALGGAGIGAWRGGGDWKKALKSALIGMVTGAIAAPAVHAGYGALFGPKVINYAEAVKMVEGDPDLRAEWERQGMPLHLEPLQALLRSKGRNVQIVY